MYGFRGLLHDSSFMSELDKNHSIDEDSRTQGKKSKNEIEWTCVFNVVDPGSFSVVVADRGVLEQGRVSETTVASEKMSGKKERGDATPSAITRIHRVRVCVHPCRERFFIAPHIDNYKVECMIRALGLIT